MSQSAMMPLSDQHTLQSLAQAMTEACPDMRQHAREIALDILHQHGLQALEPDTVYLNRFTSAHSAATFSGWAHEQQPFQSVTLPQLVMHRFNAKDADNADLLSYLSGFYTDGPGADSYDAHNEVPLKPADVLEYFWEIDFSADFNSRIQSFWSARSDAFRTLAKVNFMSKVLEVRIQEPGSALAECCAQVARTLVGDYPWPLSLAQLHERVTVAPGLRLCTFDIGGYVATDMLRIVLDDGRQLLYTPGAVDALHLFADSHELYWWVLNSNNYDENRALFSRHFALKDREEHNDNLGLNHLTDLLYEGWGKQTYAGLNVLDQTISDDPFTWLRDKARQRMLDDAKQALHSNADLRKQLWIGYLGAFNEVFSPLAALDWPVALVAVGAGLAETGLNIDQAIHGRTTAERKTAITGAIFAAIDTLFSATFLLGAPGEAAIEVGERLPETPKIDSSTTTGEPAETEQAAGEDTGETPTQGWVPSPFLPGDTRQILAPFETNVVLAGQAGVGDLEGIYLQEGKFYALVDFMPYQVRYVNELKSWVIVDPENPYSFYNSHIIRLPPEGQWQLAPRLALKGGMPLDWLKAWKHSSKGKTTPSVPATPYDIPEAIRPKLAKAAASLASDKVLSGAHADLANPDQQSAYLEFRARRDQLAADATGFFDNPVLPERPQPPQLTPSATPKELIQKVYETANGLVVGEAHSEIGSKRFLVDNMGLLRTQNVQTLYMEHYMTDFQQADLDTFNRTGNMPEALDEYVNRQDEGHNTDPQGRYTFRQVMLRAQSNGIRIQSIDCMASYRQAWLTLPPRTIRQQMMNFYAHTIIEADQTLRGVHRWIALVGNTHSDRYLGIAGVGDIEGALTLRCEDVPLGQPNRIDPDPGLEVLDSDRNVVCVQSDFRLQAAVSTKAKPATTLEQRLPNPGDYLIDKSSEPQVLVNRSRDGALRRTPILRDGRFIYIERADWPWVNKRRLLSMGDLHTSLKLHGLRPASP